MLYCLLIGLVVQQSDYHGFGRNDFKFNGMDAVVVEPKRPAKGNPWIWRTEFFDHRPMLDIALLDQGWRLAFLNVGNTFGCPSAIDRFTQFYSEMVSNRKLNRRVVLEGFSRGGLYAYNWAIANPDKVMAIYGDAPVCDFKTWPAGGKGGQRSESDWQELIRDCGFPNELAALRYPFNPVDRLAPLAEARIPLIHVVGDADSVVPVGPNTNLVEQRYKALGGTIKVIHKPGLDHYPHSLDDPKPILDFLSEHAEDSTNAKPATLIPAPNPESRYDSAGWQGRSWLDQHKDSCSVAKLLQPRVVLIGDSITQGFGGPGRKVGSAGEEAFKRYLSPLNAIQMGISGDRTQHVLWRIADGALDDCKPDWVVLLIGVNNLHSDSPHNIAGGIIKSMQSIHLKQPLSKLILMALFPTGRNPDSPERHAVNSINKELKGFCKSNSYPILLDITQDLLLKDGSTDFTKMAGDSLHLVQGGYEVWARALASVIASHT